MRYISFLLFFLAEPPQGCSKMPRCKASEIPRSETYFVGYVAATRDEGTPQMGVFQQP
jgi:hypothetical protein